MKRERLAVPEATIEKAVWVEEEELLFSLLLLQAPTFKLSSVTDYKGEFWMLLPVMLIAKQPI